MIKKLFAKLVNWESVRGAHKPSAEEIFQREQRREKELADEREQQQKKNIQEKEWEEIKLPEGTEQNPE